MTAGLRIKQRAVTTQEAAVEDDRSARLQIGTVGVRGQLMNTHTLNKPHSNEDVSFAPRRIHRWCIFLFFFPSRREVVTVRKDHVQLLSNK